MEKLLHENQPLCKHNVHAWNICENEQKLSRTSCKNWTKHIVDKNTEEHKNVIQNVPRHKNFIQNVPCRKNMFLALPQMFIKPDFHCATCC